MKRKLLSVLLVLAMALTLLPTAAFAAGETAGTTAPKVAGYGFVWDAEKYKGDSAEKLTGGFNAGSDWMGETMYVAFAENGLANGTNLWFEVTVGTDPNADVWGCAATATAGKNMFAFSFLNRGTQWEQHPTIDGETFDYTGANVTHAKSYMKAGSATLKVYTPTQPITGEQASTPSNLGDVVFERTISITEKNDVMEVVEDKPVATPVSIGITAATQADTTTPPVEGPLSTEYSVATADTTVTVTAKNIKEHKNGANNTGYWIGATFTPKATDTTDTTEYVILYKDSNSKWAIDTDSCTDGSIVSLYIDAFKNGTLNTTGGQITVGVFAKADAFNGDTVKANLDDSAAKLTKTYTVKASTDCTKYTATPSTPELTFNNKTNETEVLEFAGRKLDTLGKFDVNKDTKTGKILVTGTANYLEWEAFNTAVEAEQSGYYILYRAVLPENGWDGAKVIIPGDGDTKEITGFTAEDRVLDVPMHVDKDAPEKMFTVRYVFNDVTKTYTVDWSGVVLLPQVEQDEDVTDATTVTVPSEKADEMADLIKDAEKADDGTTENAPVSVVVSGSGDNINKTLVFDATADETVDGSTNKGHTVTLPSGLANKMGTQDGDSKADVKVNSGVGSVTVPSAALPTTGNADNVKVSIKEVTAVTVTAANIETPEGTTLSADEGATIVNAVKTATGVTVEAKKGSSDLLAGNDSEAKAVTITITGLDNTKTYVLLCVTDDGKVTSFGEFSGNTSITVTSTHLTKFIPVVKTDANKDALAKVALDDGKVTPAPVPSDIVITSDVDSGAIGRKVTVTGLTAATVTVQIARPGNTAPAVVFNTPKATAENGFNVNAGSVVTVWDGVVTFAGGVPSAPIPSASDPYTVPANS